MKGIVYSKEAVDRIFEKMCVKMSVRASTVEKSRIHRCVRYGMVIGNIIPLDEDKCLELNTGKKLITSKEKLWLRRAIKMCLEFGEVIEFDEESGRLV